MALHVVSFIAKKIRSISFWGVNYSINIELYFIYILIVVTDNDKLAITK